MLRFVLRQLQLDPVRTTLTSLALAAVVAVILVFEGFMEGIVAQSRNAVLERGADLIVTQAGIKNMMAARSILPQFTRSEVEAVSSMPSIATRMGEGNNNPYQSLKLSDECNTSLRYRCRALKAVVAVCGSTNENR